MSDAGRDGPGRDREGSSIGGADDGSPPARTESADDGPPVRGGSTGDGTPAPSENPIRWYLGSDNGLVVASRDVLVSVLAVLAVGLLLFAVSGVWPPLVAVESESMVPNFQQGDLVFVVDNERFVHEAATEHGVVTRERGAEASHESFGEPGNVIVYRPDGGDGTPIIHRAEMRVEEGENWASRGDPEDMAGFDDCDDRGFENCPAPHDGYVTKGDANGAYDQIEGQSTVVRPEWIKGKAVARVPYLGCIRLALTPGPGCW